MTNDKHCYDDNDDAIKCKDAAKTRNRFEASPMVFSPNCDEKVERERKKRHWRLQHNGF